MLRRIRSALVLAVVWAIVWLPLGVLLGVGMGWLTFPVPSFAFRYLGIWTALGAISGAAFALLMALLERNRTVEQLSSRRLATWGALAGAGVPVALTTVLIVITKGSFSPDAPGIFVVMAIAGAVSAWGTLVLARRDSHLQVPMQRPPNER